MLRVRCQATATLDDKGRLALPAVLRRAFVKHDVDSLVLTYFGGALWGWTPEVFERNIEGPIAAQDPFDQAVVQFSHAILAPAQDLDLDRQGRIRVPQLLRDLASLNKEVVVNSLADRLEIWDKATWDARFEACLKAAPSLTGMPRSS
ncbi:MAG: division/cell wall cluster transcriptional repressor MraZ [Myxococcota bacterium]